MPTLHTKNRKIPKQKKGLFRLVHFQTIIFLVLYFVASNFIFVRSVFHSNIYISFLAPFLFGLTASFVFLYLFGHKDFFHFISKFEKEEESKEQKYLNKFSKYGRILASIIVAGVAGSIFLALTVRFLFTKSENRYLMAFLATLISTIFAVAFAKGFLGIIFR